MQMQTIAYLFLLILAGCSQTKDTPSVAAEIVEMEQHRGVQDERRMDEELRQDLTVALTEPEPGEWAKQDYETVERWLERLQKELTTNQIEVDRLKKALDQQTVKERAQIEKVGALVKRNEKMRTILSDRQTASQPRQKTFHSQKIPEAPFFVHFTKKGDTLVSIAREYYNDEDAAPDILLWNQGWIRTPEELIAGLALVLFPKDAEEKHPKVVDRFLTNLERLSKEPDPQNNGR